MGSRLVVCQSPGVDSCQATPLGTTHTHIHTLCKKLPTHRPLIRQTTRDIPPQVLVPRTLSPSVDKLRCGNNMRPLQVLPLWSGWQMHLPH